MAARDVSGFNGAVTLPSSIGGNAKAFTIRRTTTRKDINIYGNDRFNRARLGIVKIAGTITIVLQVGAASTTPNFIAPAADGAALTLQLEIMSTLTGTALFPDLDVNHAFEDPAVFGTQGYEFNGVVAESWAAT